MKSTKLLDHFEYDMLRAMQYCYYVKHVSVIDDIGFDKVEKEWTAQTGKPIPVGSDKESSYAPHERALGMYLMARAYVDQKENDLI